MCFYEINVCIYTYVCETHVCVHMCMCYTYINVCDTLGYFSIAFYCFMKDNVFEALLFMLAAMFSNFESVTDTNDFFKFSNFLLHIVLQQKSDNF